jgi:hypothetical protein
MGCLCGCDLTCTPCTSPSALIPVGTHELRTPQLTMVDYVSDEGKYNGSSYTGVVSDFDDVANVPTDGMDWVCEDDSAFDVPEVSLPVDQFADLLAKANAWDKAVQLGQVHVHSIEECATCTP